MTYQVVAIAVFFAICILLKDENASKNIRAEGIRQLSVLGTRTAAEGGEVRPKGGRKSVLRHSPTSSEAPSVTCGGVVHE